MVRPGGTEQDNTGYRLNSESVERLLASQYQGLLVLVRRKIPDPHVAADLLNSAMVTTLEHLQDGRITDTSHIGGYVYRVALNLLKNHRRKSDERLDRRVEVDANALAAEPADDPLESAWAERVRKLIEELPASRDRVLLKRFYLDEDEKEDICRDLRITALHFDKLIFRARRRIKALFDTHGFKKADFLSLLLPLVAA